MKRFILLLVTLFAMTNVMAQLQPDMPIPADKEVRVGRLENGMTYYIRHNEKPKGQASFYIFHHVGVSRRKIPNRASPTSSSTWPSTARKTSPASR